MKGRRPRASSRRRYEWGYLFGFVQPETGETFNIVGTTVSAEVFGAVLAQFAKDVGVGPAKQIALVIDGAGWHKAKDLVVPTGIHLILLPPYSPELQPAERLWPLINEGIANRTFMTLDALVKVVSKQCLYLEAEQDLVRRLTNYHWWPSTQRLNGRES